MKATELIAELQKLVAEHGDFEQVVVCDEEYRLIKLRPMQGLHAHMLEIEAEWDGPGPDWSPKPPC